MGNTCGSQQPQSASGPNKTRPRSWCAALLHEASLLLAYIIRHSPAILLLSSTKKSNVQFGVRRIARCHEHGAACIENTASGAQKKQARA
jgi:hypothetical protein